MGERDQIKAAGISSSQRGSTLQHKEGSDLPGYKVNFSKLLSIDSENPIREPLINELSPSNKGDHITRFNTSYSLRQGSEDVILPNRKINTKLVYPTPDMLDSSNMCVYVWEII